MLQKGGRATSLGITEIAEGMPSSEGQVDRGLVRLPSISNLDGGHVNESCACEFELLSHTIDGDLLGLNVFECLHPFFSLCKHDLANAVSSLVVVRQ